jgi:hypothetical protein
VARVSTLTASCPLRAPCQRFHAGSW